MNKHITNQIIELLLKLGYTPRMYNYSDKPIFNSKGECIGTAQVSYGYPNNYVKLYIGDLTISSEWQILELLEIYKKLLFELEILGLKVTNDNKHVKSEVNITMNKYQEALDRKVYVESEHYDEKDINLLQELVDKATPKKPYFLNYGGYQIGNWKCPICDGFVARDNYCKYCGQALDWSDEDDK